MFQRQHLKKVLYNKTSMKFLFLFLISGFFIMNGQDKNSENFPAVEIPGTQLHHIHSSIVDQEYNLYINLPREYGDTAQTFPVIYLLDAQWDFPLLNAIYGEQYYDGFLPGIITVGITWGGENPDPDWLRARDFTPTNTSRISQSGNAENFLAFIKKELIPFIESEYRAKKDDRVLMGSSLGGLFTLYALFHETELFNRYVLTSPALGWDSGITYKYEENYAENNSRLPVKLYMAIGDLEGGVPDFEKFIEQIKSHNYEGLDLRTKILEETGHSGGKAEGYTRGLQFVFKRPSLKLDSSVLKRYTGNYKFSPNINIKIIAEDGHLVVFTPDNSKLILHAESENDFYVHGSYSFVHFKKDDSGKVTGFQLRLFNGEQFLEKIN